MLFPDDLAQGQGEIQYKVKFLKHRGAQPQAQFPTCRLLIKHCLEEAAQESGVLTRCLGDYVQKADSVWKGRKCSNRYKNNRGRGMTQKQASWK